MRASRRLSVSVLVVVALTGCDCGGHGGGGGTTEPPGGTSGEGPPGTAETGEAIPMGTIEGVVRLAEGAPTPRYDPNPFVGDGPRALPPECTPPSAADAEPMHVVGGRALTNVPVVAEPVVREGAVWPERGTPEIHEIHFADCRPTPSVVVLTRGDRLRLVNDMEYPFFPHLGPGGFFEGLIPGEPRELSIDVTGPQTMTCAMTAMCGNTEILSFGHPVHTVTGEDGRFRLEVPAGQEVTITAWHPLFGNVTSSARATVAVGETVSVEITVTPGVVAAPSAPAPTDDPPDEAPF